jgi:ketosteroid isomerase-like protein
MLQQAMDQTSGDLCFARSLWQTGAAKSASLSATVEKKLHFCTKHHSRMQWMVSGCGLEIQKAPAHLKQ